MPRCGADYEKIHWLMLHVYDESYGKYADKYAVRDYVKSCGLEDLLIPVYGVYDRAGDIDYDALPDEFVLMTTHGSGEGYYELVHDKRTMDVAAVNRKLDRALKTPFWKHMCEYHYKKIPPRILSMEMLKPAAGDRMTDYKVVCCNGTPAYILVCSNRNGRDYYDTDWQYVDFSKEAYRSEEAVPRPSSLEQMLDAAKRLSAPFPLARVDFYDVSGKLYFGEVTLTPASGNHSTLNEKGQRTLGGLIRLPEV